MLCHHGWNGPAHELSHTSIVWTDARISGSNSVCPGDERIHFADSIHQQRCFEPAECVHPRGDQGCERHGDSSQQMRANGYFGGAYIVVHAVGWSSHLQLGPVPNRQHASRFSGHRTSKTARGSRLCGWRGRTGWVRGVTESAEHRRARLPGDRRWYGSGGEGEGCIDPYGRHGGTPG